MSENEHCRGATGSSKAGKGGHKDANKGSHKEGNKEGDKPGAKKDKDDHKIKFNKICKNIKNSSNSKTTKCSSSNSSSSNNNNNNSNGACSTERIIVFLKDEVDKAPPLESPPACHLDTASQSPAASDTPTKTSDVDSDSDDDVTRQLARISRRMRGDSQSNASLVRYLDESETRRRRGSNSDLDGWGEGRGAEGRGGEGRGGGAALRERCDRLARENDALSDLLAAKKGECEDTRLHYRARVNDLEDELARVVGEKARLADMLRLPESERDALAVVERDVAALKRRLDQSEARGAELVAENNELKQDLRDAELEMREMHDHFAAEESVELRELQRELESTARDCRLLHFKLRKAERRNDQLSSDCDEYEEKLGQLEGRLNEGNQGVKGGEGGQGLEGVEEELRVAKEVSIRLHDECERLHETCARYLRELDARTRTAPLLVDGMVDDAVKAEILLDPPSLSEGPPSPPEREPAFPSPHDTPPLTPRDRAPTTSPELCPRCRQLVRGASPSTGSDRGAFQHTGSSTSSQTTGHTASLATEHTTNVTVGHTANQTVDQTADQRTAGFDTPIHTDQIYSVYGSHDGVPESSHEQTEVDRLSSHAGVRVSGSKQGSGNGGAQSSAHSGARRHREETLAALQEAATAPTELREAAEVSGICESTPAAVEVHDDAIQSRDDVIPIKTPSSNNSADVHSKDSSVSSDCSDSSWKNLSETTTALEREVARLKRREAELLGANCDLDLALRRLRRGASGEGRLMNCQGAADDETGSKEEILSYSNGTAEEWPARLDNQEGGAGVHAGEVRRLQGEVHRLQGEVAGCRRELDALLDTLRRKERQFADERKGLERKNKELARVFDMLTQRAGGRGGEGGKGGEGDQTASNSMQTQTTETDPPQSEEFANGANGMEEAKEFAVTSELHSASNGVADHIAADIEAADGVKLTRDAQRNGALMHSKNDVIRSADDVTRARDDVIRRKEFLLTRALKSLHELEAHTEQRDRCDADKERAWGEKERAWGEREAGVRAVEARCAELEGQAADLRAQVSSSTASLKCAQQDLKQRDLLLQRAQQELKQRDMLLQRARDRILERDKQKEESDAKIKLVESELAALRAKTDVDKADSELLRRDLERCREKVRELEREIENSCHAQIRALAEWRRDRERLEARSAQLERDKRDFCTQLHELRLDVLIARGDQHATDISSSRIFGASERGGGDEGRGGGGGAERGRQERINKDKHRSTEENNHRFNPAAQKVEVKNSAMGGQQQITSLLGGAQQGAGAGRALQIVGASEQEGGGGEGGSPAVRRREKRSDAPEAFRRSRSLSELDLLSAADPDPTYKVDPAQPITFTPYSPPSIRPVLSPTTTLPPDPRSKVRQTADPRSPSSKRRSPASRRTHALRTPVNQRRSPACKPRSATNQNEANSPKSNEPTLHQAPSNNVSGGQGTPSTNRSSFYESGSLSASASRDPSPDMMTSSLQGRKMSPYPAAPPSMIISPPGGWASDWVRPGGQRAVSVDRAGVGRDLRSPADAALQIKSSLINTASSLNVDRTAVSLSAARNTGCGQPMAAQGSGGRDLASNRLAATSAGNTPRRILPTVHPTIHPLLHPSVHPFIHPSVHPSILSPGDASVRRSLDKHTSIPTLLEAASSTGHVLTSQSQARAPPNSLTERAHGTAQGGCVPPLEPREPPRGKQQRSFSASPRSVRRRFLYEGHTSYDPPVPSRPSTGRRVLPQPSIESDWSDSDPTLDQSIFSTAGGTGGPQRPGGVTGGPQGPGEVTGGPQGPAGGQGKSADGRTLKENSHFDRRTVSVVVSPGKVSSEACRQRVSSSKACDMHSRSLGGCPDGEGVSKHKSISFDDQSDSVTSRVAPGQRPLLGGTTKGRVGTSKGGVLDGGKERSHKLLSFSKFSSLPFFHRKKDQHPPIPVWDDSVVNSDHRCSANQNADHVRRTLSDVTTDESAVRGTQSMADLPKNQFSKYEQSGCLLLELGARADGDKSGTFPQNKIPTSTRRLEQPSLVRAMSGPQSSTSVSPEPFSPTRAHKDDLPGSLMTSSLNQIQLSYAGLVCSNIAAASTNELRSSGRGRGASAVSQAPSSSSRMSKIIDPLRRLRGQSPRPRELMSRRSLGGVTSLSGGVTSLSQSVSVSSDLQDERRPSVETTTKKKRSFFKSSFY